MSARRLLAVYPYVPYPPDFGGRIRCFHLLELLREHFRVELAILTNPEDDSATVQELGARVDRMFVIPAPSPPHLSRRQKIRNILTPEPWEVSLRSVQLERLVYERSAECDMVFVDSGRLLSLRHCSRSEVHVLDADDLAYIMLYRRLKKMTALKRRLGYTLEFFKTFLYELKGIAKFDVILVASDEDFQRLHRWNRKLPLHIVPNGVNTERFSRNDVESSKDNLILFLGALDYEPNEFAVMWLCRSIFPKIRRHIPQAKLHLVGRNPSRLVQSLTGPGIELARNVPDVRPYLYNSRVVVVPITMGGGTRIKILEAAAAGRPVVSTSIGAEGLRFIPGIEIEIADNEEEFVRKTIELLSNRVKAEEMGKLARSRVEREYTWEMSKRRLAEAISPWL